MSVLNRFFPGFLVALVASTAAAQTALEPPRFGGDRATASSTEAAAPTEPQQENNRQLQPQLNTLIGAAMLEAAREEGRYFVEDLRLRNADSGVD